MHQSKLISLLRTFQPKEIRRFDDYLQSPFFGTPADVLRLWASLSPLGPEFPEKSVDRFEVFGTAFKGQALPSDAEMARIMNALLSKAEEFLAICSMLESPAELSLRAMSAYEVRGLDKHFQASMRRLHRAIDALPYRNQHWHFLQYEAAGQEVRNQTRRQVRGIDRNIDDMATALDAFYLCVRLRIACEIINQQSILSGTASDQNLAPLWALLAASKASESVAVQLHAQVLHMLAEADDTQHFTRLQTLLKAHGGALSEEERRDIFSFSQNYCIRRVRLGDLDFLRALFDLYQDAIRDGILLEEGVISPWKYKNIASVGLQVGEYKWVEDFVTRYRAHLPENFRENAFAYNMADLYYHQGEYAKSLRMLGQVEFTDVFYALGTRKLQLKIYYEQGETESLHSLIASFRTYLHRNKVLAEDTRKAYAHFVGLLHSLWKADQGGKAGNLIPEIEATQPLVEEAWLRKMALRD